MATAAVVLDRTRYVRINALRTSLLLQAHRDSVRIVMSKVQPALSNTAYHTLQGGDPPLPIYIADIEVWALSVSDKSSLVVTEFDHALPVAEVLRPKMFNEYAHRHTGVLSTLAVATTGLGAETSVTVVNSAVFTVGDDIQISNGTVELTFAKVMSILGNVLTLDRRIDNAHEIGTTVEKVIFDLRTVAGTLVAPVEYIIKPEGTSIVHIEHLNISMVHSTAGDMGLFGSLPRLVNGVLVRKRVNGVYRTLTNWKDNDEMKDDMYDIGFNTRSSGGGSYGTSGRWAFEQFGVEVRLDAATDDQLEIYIQDDLTALNHFSIKAQGHYEDN